MGQVTSQVLKIIASISSSTAVLSVLLPNIILVVQIPEIYLGQSKINFVQLYLVPSTREGNNNLCLMQTFSNLNHLKYCLHKPHSTNMSCNMFFKQWNGCLQDIHTTTVQKQVILHNVDMIPVRNSL